jgi:hypothetical protein
MKVWKPLMAGAAAAFAAVVVLSLVFSVHDAKRSLRSDMAVFRPVPISRIGNDNLVDALLSQPFTEKIRRTDLRSDVLSVDFLVDRGTVRPDGMYDDVTRLIRLSFRQSGNVERLLVRFVDQQSDVGNERLLLAADIRRSDKWLMLQPEGTDEAVSLEDAIWQRRLRLSFTDAWKLRFGTTDIRSS